MTITSLHQALGRQPGPIDSEMLDEAIAIGLEEGDTIDWKSDLPKEKELAQSDVVKDIAAFANSGAACSYSASPRTNARRRAVTIPAR